VATEVPNGGVALSVVIPVWNEADSVGPLHEALERVLARIGREYEIIFVDDGSTDGTLDRLEGIARRDPRVRVVVLRSHFGKSAALAAGFDQARGGIVITMDGDLQDDPEEIPAFLEKMEEGFDLVSGWKKKRRDPLSKTWPSRIFNFVTAKVTGIRLHDFNCGFKAYRREVVRELDLYGELHRFIPVLAARRGFRIGEKVVQHHPRRFGRTKFGASRFLNGFLDLLTVMFMTTHQRSPLHVFGRIGLAFLGVGILINLYMVYIWLTEHALRVRPMLLFAVVLVILGIQFITMGLLGEMIAGQKRERPYAVARVIAASGHGGKEGGD
jgi:glycosyltransferase involved in cell wall biosynthesis